MRLYDLKRDSEWLICFKKGTAIETSREQCGYWIGGSFVLPDEMIQKRASDLNFVIKKGYYLAEVAESNPQGELCWVIYGTELNHQHKTFIPVVLLAGFVCEMRASSR